MILEWLVGALENVVGFIAGLFPVFDVGASFSSWHLVVEYGADINYFVPLSEVFAITLAVFIWLPALMTMSLGLWLVGFLRGGSSRA